MPDNPLREGVILPAQSKIDTRYIAILNNVFMSLFLLFILGIYISETIFLYPILKKIMPLWLSFNNFD